MRAGLYVLAPGAVDMTQHEEDENLCASPAGASGRLDRREAIPGDI